MGGAKDRGLQDFVASRFSGLRRTAYLMCGDWEIAQDLVCTVLAEIVLDGPTAEADLRARRAVFDGFTAGWRRLPRRRERVFAANPDDPDIDPVVQISVLAGLSRLPPRQRAIVVLRHGEGLDVDEVADILGIAPPTVRTQEAHGLAALDGLGDLLERVFDAEPVPDDPVAAVYRRAERLRRRRARTVLAAGMSAAMSAALVGHLLTGVVAIRLAAVSADRLASSDTSASPSVGGGVAAQATPSTAGSPPADPFAADPVGARVSSAVSAAGLRLRPDRVAGGVGWRRYAVVDPSAAPQAQPRGTVQVLVYTLPGGVCFPVLSARGRVCARAERTDDGGEFVRYADDTANPPFHEVIMRRRSDGRTVAVVAVGVPHAAAPKPHRPDESAAPHDPSDTEPPHDPDRTEAPHDPDRTEAPHDPDVEATHEPNDAEVLDELTRPALTALEVTELATDPGLADAFGADEWCDLEHPQCPSLRVPLPVLQPDVPAEGG